MTAGAIVPPTAGRQVLAAASSGGHFKQLVALVARIPRVSEVIWLTYDSGLSHDLLQAVGRGHERLVHAPYAAPRDLPNLARNARVARRLLRQNDVDLAISTGAGIAVAVLPMARVMGARAVFVESATRAQGASLSGRILERIPGVDLFTQNPGYGARWIQAASVHDEFEPGPDREVGALRRVVVSLGTIRPYGFRRLLERLVEVLPDDAEVLWQTGETDVSDLAVEANRTVPGPVFEAAVRDADVVVAHAGTGTAITAFEQGRCPVLVPRRHHAGEHVDDHQVGTAQALATRGLAVRAEVEDLTPELLLRAARRTVTRRTEVPPFEL